MTYKLDDERRKLITEKLLGECWHEIANDPVIHNNGIKCVICKKYAKHDSSTRYGIVRRTFTIDTDMMAVFRKLVDIGRWLGFKNWSIKGWDIYKQIHEKYISHDVWLFYDPERFCWLASEWMEKNK